MTLGGASGRPLFAVGSLRRFGGRGGVKALLDESFLEFWVWVVSPSPEKDEAFLYFAPAPLPSSSTVGGEESRPEKGIRMAEF